MKLLTSLQDCKIARLQCCKRLLRIHFIGCQGLKIWVLEFGHNLSFEVLSLWVFEFYPNYSFWVFFTVWNWVLSQLEFWILSQFDFLSFLTILVIFSFLTILNLSQVEFWFVTLRFFTFCHQLSFWVFSYSEFDFLSLVVISVFEFCHNLNLWGSPQFEFLSIVTVWVFEFCHNLSGVFFINKVMGNFVSLKKNKKR